MRARFYIPLKEFIERMLTSFALGSDMRYMAEPYLFEDIGAHTVTPLNRPYNSLNGLSTCIQAFIHEYT